MKKPRGKKVEPFNTDEVWHHGNANSLNESFPVSEPWQAPSQITPEILLKDAEKFEDLYEDADCYKVLRYLRWCRHLALPADWQILLSKKE